MLVIKYLKVLVIALPWLCFSNLAASAEHQIMMLSAGAGGSMVFEPAVLKVAVGDTVTFIATQPEHDSISVVTPEGANQWHGKRGETVSVTINKEGVYLYKCAPHFYFAMVGVIQAGQAKNILAVRAEAEEMSAKFFINQNRLKQYLTQIDQ